MDGVSSDTVYSKVARQTDSLDYQRQERGLVKNADRSGEYFTFSACRAARKLRRRALDVPPTV